MTVEDAAAELYVSPPADFVRRRTELAAAAREQDDRATAAAIASLRKPTVGAWLANLLNRDHREQLEELVDLGAALREAQGTLDADQLRELGKQRYRVVRVLVRLAGVRAAELGHVPGPAADAELESTLTAALADPAAAEQLLTGRLTRGLTYAGLGFGAAATQVAGTQRAGTQRAGPQRAAAATGPKPVRAAQPAPADDEASRAAALAAELDAAERDLAQARLQAAAAASAADSARERQETALDRLRTTRDEVERIGAALAAAEADVRAAQAELDAATRENVAAARAATEAADLADRVEQGLQAMRSSTR